jgi:F1F0 ATPase subunit 2
MSHQGPLLIALTTGMLLGVFVFAGLWWTVRRGLDSPNPALWFGVSALARLAVVFAIFHYMALAGLANIGLCLLGLLVGRVAVTRFIRSLSKDQPCV